MIIHGGEPPFVEEPNPKFGGVIRRLNDLAYVVQEQTASYNESTKIKLLDFQTNINKFVNDVVIPIAAHINKKGAVHSETKVTVGLGKKDNFRTATLAEQTSLADVDAFVTVQGSRSAILANQPVFNDTSYQQNNVLQMASYFYPNDYPTAPPPTVERIRYLGVAGVDNRATILFNGDRMVFSVPQDRTVYARSSLFLSGPSMVHRKTQLEEIPNVVGELRSYNWNGVGAKSSNGKINLFKPIADKAIHEFTDNLGMSASLSRDFLLFSSFGGVVYKGLSTAISLANATTLSVEHKAFKVDAFETNPAVVPMVSDSYLANYSLMGDTRSGAFNAAHTYTISDFLTLPAGASAVFDSAVIPTIGTWWEGQDYEARVFMAAKVKVTLASGAIVNLVLRFTDSIIPGTLVAGGVATVKTVGTFVKDVLAADGTLPANAQRFEYFDLYNLNSPVLNPGVVLGTGEMVRASATKNVLRVKRFDTTFKSFKDWCVGPRPVVAAPRAFTEYTTPARHLSFSSLPDRIIPVSKSSTSTHYLVYGVDQPTSKYSWQDLSWGVGDVYDGSPSNRYSVKTPATTKKPTDMWAFPAGLSTYIAQGIDEVNNSALVFNRYNDYKGYQTFSFVNSVLTLQNPVALSPASLLTIQGKISGFMARAAALNPDPRLAALREVQIQVYALALNKAVYSLSDGLGYVEIGIAPYIIVNGLFTLDFVNGAMQIKPVTPAVTTPYGNSRRSASGDDVAIVYSDLLAYQIGSDTFDVVINRVYGNLYGDVSFRIISLGSANPNVIAQGNNPARLYEGTDIVDAVEELYPAVLLHNLGVFTHNPSQNNRFTTILTKQGNPAISFDPYSQNDSSWVYLPSGMKVVIGGTGYVLYRGQSVRVNPSGVTYCYLVKTGETLSAIGSDKIRETSNAEVLFGIATNGVLEMNRHYLVVANHLISSSRLGSAVPYFEDDGQLGPNKFFTQRDRI